MDKDILPRPVLRAVATFHPENMERLARFLGVALPGTPPTHPAYPLVLADRIHRATRRSPPGAAPTPKKF